MLPDFENNPDNFGVVGLRATAPIGLEAVFAAWAATLLKQLAGILALMPGDTAELIEERAFGTISGVAPVTAAHRFKVFVSGCSAHGSRHAPRCPRL